MKKCIPFLAVCIILTGLVTPVNAQEEAKESWLSGFTKLFSFFDVFRKPMPPIGRDEPNPYLTLTPTPTYLPGKNPEERGIMPEPIVTKSVGDRPHILPVTSFPKQRITQYPESTGAEEKRRPTWSYNPETTMPPERKTDVGRIPTQFKRPPSDDLPATATKQKMIDGFENKTEKSKTTAETGGKNTADAARTSVAKLIDSYDNRLSNYTEFLSKVKSRRDKLVGEGGDVANLDAFIGTATTNLTAATQALTAAKMSLAALDYTVPVKSLKSEISLILSPLKQTMVTLHTSMSEAVKTIVKTSAANRDGNAAEARKSQFMKVSSGATGAGGQYMMKQKNPDAENVPEAAKSRKDLLEGGN